MIYSGINGITGRCRFPYTPTYAKQNGIGPLEYKKNHEKISAQIAEHNIRTDLKRQRRITYNRPFKQIDANPCNGTRGLCSRGMNSTKSGKFFGTVVTGGATNAIHAYQKQIQYRTKIIPGIFLNTLV